MKKTETSPTEVKSNKNYQQHNIMENAEELLARQSADHEAWLNRVPDSVTNYQIKQALNTVPEDRTAVEALVAASEDQNLIDGWNHAASLKKDHTLFIGAVALLGWSQEKVDDYLKLAITFS
jgi:hypothetical protein